MLQRCFEVRPEAQRDNGRQGEQPDQADQFQHMLVGHRVGDEGPLLRSMANSTMTVALTTPLHARPGRNSLSTRLP
jgi:hypothetical protein